MTDIALQWQEHDADIVIDGGDAIEDDGLETTVIISLFTDRRADPDDELPERETDPRGWWGDIADDVMTGSRMWLLNREKQLPEVRRRAVQYCQEALAWLIEDGIATEVTVEGSWLRRGVLKLDIQIFRPGRDAENFRFAYNWDAQTYAILPA